MSKAQRHDTKRGQSLWPMIYAPIVWALHFCTSYAVAAVWCAKFGPAGDALPAVIGGLSLAALALIGFIAWRSWRQWDYSDDWDYDHAEPNDEHRREFLGHAGFLLAGVSAVGVIYVAMAAVLTGVCE